MEVIPFGYAPDIATGYARLDAIMSIPKTVLIDIRLKPYCKEFPAWNSASLEVHYGKSRYIWIEDLGNLRYKSPIPGDYELKNSRPGLDRLKLGLSRGYRLVIMCGCRDYSRCHGSLVVQLLAAEVPGLVVTHPERETPDNVAKLEQAALFEVPEPARWRDI
jgi:Domain of unknown function DUF488